MSWITNTDGSEFDYAKPEPAQITIEDIAESLSKECRFTGKCRGFYSVAQHSVLVSQIVPPAFALEALLHDAHEAFTRDLSTPFKALLPDFRRIERRIDAVIRAKFNLPTVCSLEVKCADITLLATERRDLLPPSRPWPVLEGVRPLDQTIHGWPWHYARREFLERFRQIANHE